MNFTNQIVLIAQSILLEYEEICIVKVCEDEDIYIQIGKTEFNLNNSYHASDMMLSDIAINVCNRTHKRVIVNFGGTKFKIEEY